MKLKLSRVNDPELRKKCNPVSVEEMQTEEIQSFIDAMIDFVRRRCYKGKTARQDRVRSLGMAANQFGRMKTIIVLDFAIGNLGFSDIHALINPGIVWHSEKLSNNSEGCRSIPFVYGMVPRFEEIRVKAMDRSGNSLEVHAKGWLSVLIQHEIDHLNGILFIDRLVDPKKAYFVRNGQFHDYRQNCQAWTQFIDVSPLIINL